MFAAGVDEPLRMTRKDGFVLTRMVGLYLDRFREFTGFTGVTSGSIVALSKRGTAIHAGMDVHGYLGRVPCKHDWISG
jgi:hypothetical protein